MKPIAIIAEIERREKSIECIDLSHLEHFAWLTFLVDHCSVLLYLRKDSLWEYSTAWTGVAPKLGSNPGPCQAWIIL